MKETMLQYFQWYSRADGFLYTRLRKAAPLLAQAGFTMIWMPPAYKGASGKKDTGYAPYDLYDLGEFHQKGAVRTKYGNVRQLQAAVQALHDNHLALIADIVFNHRMGGDEKERVRVHPKKDANRLEAAGPDFECDLFTRYTFPARSGIYSDFVWTKDCFKASDQIRNRERQILLFDGKKWDENVSKEQGSFDYIMGMDVDTSASFVKDELYRWGIWFTRRLGVDGYRLDAIKSMDAGFFPGWIAAMRKEAGAGAFAVGEYWSGNLGELEHYLNASRHCMRLFDVPLHYHFYDCSHSQGSYDVRKLFEGTLSQAHPEYAVAFVDNHDTQPGQALASWVMDWFKTSAYAMILLYKCEVPCVFLGDMSGVRKTHSPKVALLEEMVWIRKNLLSGPVKDLFDQDPQKACWISLSDHPVLVLFTIGDAKSRSIQFEQLAGLRFEDISRPGHVIGLDANGNGTFDCQPGCCSIYLLEKDAAWLRQALY